MTDLNVTVNHTYKARIFEMIFSDKKELLSLYNAVNGTNYTDPSQLEINTLNNAIYMSMHNDVSFIIDSRLSLYEHQSTFSPNLPLRYLLYVTDLYSSMIKDANLYGTKLIQIPAPKFIIFYNGREQCPERQELRLSASFNVPDAEPSLELRATLLNINPGYNEDLKKACKTLNDYSKYTARVRLYTETMTLEDAVNRAVDECIWEGILTEFLSKNKAEAIKMSIYEYDEEKHMRQTREEGFEDGFEDGFDAGTENGVKALIQTCQELSFSKQESITMILKHFTLSEKQLHEYLEKYWIEDKNVSQHERSITQATRMSIYAYDEEKLMRQIRQEGFEDGYDAGREDSIKALIQTCQKLSLSEQKTKANILEHFALSDSEIQKFMEKYWISDNK